VALKVKPGVRFDVVAPAGYRILEALRLASRRLGHDLTITCGSEAHDPADPHSLGEAFDVRCHDLMPEDRPKVVPAVMDELGWERFYGVLEAPNTSNAHFHFQRRKGTVYTFADYLAA
jgi:hypothetical protein